MKGARRTAREMALKILYSLQTRDTGPDEMLPEFWANFRFREDILGEPLEEFDEQVPFEVRRFTEDLVRGVLANQERIDTMVEDLSTNWSVDRMARVDLAILRLGAYELLCRPETPASVVINEAIEIGKRYGTRETPAFVNGILDKISRQHRPPSA